MIMNALVIGGDVQESTFYDQLTGAQKPGYVVALTVLDRDTKEKYECQVADGIARLEELKEAQRRKEPPDVLGQIAAQLKMELPPEMTALTLEVLRFKGKQAAFIKLVCRLVVVQ